MNPKIALYWGAFDPPQLAHEEIARQIIQKLNLDKLFIVPSWPRPDKAYKASVKYRKRLMEIFVSSIGSSKAELRDDFLDWKIENTTLNTDKHFRNILWFSPYQIFGSDLIDRFMEWDPTWEVAFKLPKIIILRPWYPIDETKLDNYMIIDLDLTKEVSMLSSTQVREWLKSWNFAWLSAKVGSLIKENSMYI